MTDDIEMIYRHVKVIREADAALAWMPPADNAYWTPQNVKRFRDHHLRRRDTSRYRLERLLPLVSDEALPQGIAHVDLEVRRRLLQELARRRAGGGDAA